VVYLAANSTLFRSEDKGISWVNVSSGFPVAIIKGLVADRLSSKEAIYAAYNLGVYYKDKSQTSWTSFASGLPIIAGITELYAYNDSSNALLRISTYGRGVWETKMLGAPNNLPTNISQFYTLDTNTQQINNELILGNEINSSLKSDLQTSLLNQITIYPNPSHTGNFHLKATNLKDKKLSYQIIDNKGNFMQADTKGIIDDELYSTTINTLLQSGLYHIQIKVDEQIATKTLEILSIPQAK
jgi:hypothetical protein